MMTSLVAAVAESCNELRLTLSRFGLIKADETIARALTRGRWKIVLGGSSRLGGVDRFLAALGSCQSVREVEFTNFPGPYGAFPMSENQTALRAKVKKLDCAVANWMDSKLAEATVQQNFPNVTDLGLHGALKAKAFVRPRGAHAVRLHCI